MKNITHYEMVEELNNLYVELTGSSLYSSEKKSLLKGGVRELMMLIEEKKRELSSALMLIEHSELDLSNALYRQELDVERCDSIEFY